MENFGNFSDLGTLCTPRGPESWCRGYQSIVLERSEQVLRVHSPNFVAKTLEFAQFGEANECNSGFADRDLIWGPLGPAPLTRVAQTQETRF